MPDDLAETIVAVDTPTDRFEKPKVDPTLRWEFVHKDFVRLRYKDRVLYLSPLGDPGHAPALISKVREIEAMEKARGVTYPIRMGISPDVPPEKAAVSVAYIPRSALPHMRHVPAHWFAELYDCDVLGGFGYHQAESLMRALIIFRKRTREWIEANCTWARPEGQIIVMHQDFNNACAWLPLRGSSKNEGLADYLFRYRKTQTQYLRAVASAWPRISAADRQLAPKKLFEKRADLMLGAYRAKNHALGLQAFFAGMTPVYYRKYIEPRWMSSLNVPVLSGIQVSTGDLTGRMLLRSDPRGLFLGALTNCCQYPTSTADSSAWHGQESPNGGFFVVESNSHKIVCQSWVWIDEETRIIFFDSVESMSDITGQLESDVREIYTEAAKKLIHELNGSVVAFGPARMSLTGPEVRKIQPGAAGPWIGIRPPAYTDFLGVAREDMWVYRREWYDQV